MEKSRIRNSLIWIALGVVTLLMRMSLASRPEIIERIYSRGIFLGIRWVIDYLFAWFPLPLLYLFIPAVLFFVFRWGRSLWKNQDSWLQKLLHFSLSLSAFTGGIIFFFLWLWGFNYGRESVEKQLGLTLEPLNLKDLRAELETETRKIMELRQVIPGARDSALTAEFLPADMEKMVRAELESWLSQHDFPTPGRVRAFPLYPKGIFLRFSSSGLYFPFTGEGQFDAGVHPLQQPFVMAHELGHGYGFGDEGTCNFLAYLSTVRSEEPFIAYAGHLSYWRTVAVNYLSLDPEGYKDFRAQLPAGIRADLDAINENLRRYPDIMPRLRYYAYDTYLKSQGIEEGMLNYNRVVMLVRSWRAARSI